MVANTIDRLSGGVQKETNVRAKVSIWVQNASSGSLFETRYDQEQAVFDISHESQATEQHLGAQNWGRNHVIPTRGAADTRSTGTDELKHYEDPEYDSYVFDHSFDTDLSGSEAWLVGEMDECMIPQIGSYQGLQSISRRYANEARAAATKKPVLVNPEPDYASMAADASASVELQA